MVYFIVIWIVRIGEGGSYHSEVGAPGLSLAPALLRYLLVKVP